MLIRSRDLAVLVTLVLGLTHHISARAESGVVRPVEKHGQLHAEGTKIVGEHGQPVTLRGMSLFWSQWAGKYYNASVVDWLAEDWGVDAIRVAVGVHHGGYLENPEAEEAKALTVIDAALARGLYVVIDWHAHEPEPEAAAEFLARMAQAYGQHPNIIYELWNEPLPHHDWATVIKPYHEKVLRAIRQHDPDNLVILGTRSWSQRVDEAAADPVADGNVAYTLHFYAGSHNDALRKNGDKAMELGVALFVSEWGTSEANGDGGVFSIETRRWIDWMDKHHISRFNWSVHDKDESSAGLLPGAPAEGGWIEEQLSPSGRLVRSLLREAASVAPSEPTPTE